MFRKSKISHFSNRAYIGTIWRGNEYTLVIQPHSKLEEFLLSSSLDELLRLTIVTLDGRTGIPQSVTRWATATAGIPESPSPQPLLWSLLVRLSNGDDGAHAELWDILNRTPRDAWDAMERIWSKMLTRLETDIPDGMMTLDESTGRDPIPTEDSN